MNRAENTIERQISLLALAGPCVILAALFIIFIKTSFHYLYLPFTALIGIPLCGKWKMRGLAISLSFLALFVLYHYSEFSFTERLMHVGLAISLSLALLVVALSFEEIEMLMGLKREELQSVHQALLQQENHLKSCQEEWTNEHHILASKRLALEQTDKERESLLQLHQKTIEIMRSELASASQKQEHFTEELLLKRNEMNTMQAGLTEAHDQIAMLLLAQDADENKNQIYQLSEKLELREKVIVDLHAQLQESSEEISRTVKELEICSRELAHEKEVSLMNQTLSEQTLKKHMIQQTMVHEMQDSLDTLGREKELLEATLSKLQQENELLHEQDGHHLKLIKTHENLIDFLKTTLKEQEQRLQHEKERSAIAYAQVVEKEQHLLQQMSEINAQWTLAQHQLEEWQRKVSDSNEFKEALEIAHCKISILAEEKETLQRQLQQLATDQMTLTANLTEATQAWCKHEGMYRQLHNQFQEKSATLDATRSQLFHAEEKLLCVQLEHNEACIYQRSAEDKAMERHIIRMEKEYAALYRNYQKEVDALHAIVEKLMVGETVNSLVCSPRSLS